MLSASQMNNLLWIFWELGREREKVRWGWIAWVYQNSKVYSVFYAWLNIHIGFRLHVCDRRGYRFDYSFIDICMCCMCLCVCARVYAYMICWSNSMREREREKETVNDNDRGNWKGRWNLKICIDTYVLYINMKQLIVGGQSVFFLNFFCFFSGLVNEKYYFVWPHWFAPHWHIHNSQMPFCVLSDNMLLLLPY